MLPFFPNKLDLIVRGVLLDELSFSAFARKLFEALSDSLCEIASRVEISGIRNGVRRSSGSPVWLIILGVALIVPQVINCFKAAGPNSAGVGEGKFGTREKPASLGELGRSGRMN